MATLCNNAKSDKIPENMKKDIQNRGTITIGDASESTLIKFSKAVCIATKTADVEQILNNNNNTLGEIPFTSANKYQLSIHILNNNNEQPRLLVMKGATERIFDRCDFMLCNDKAEPTEDFRGQYEKDIQGLMEGGQCVLGMAYIELDPTEVHADTEGGEARVHEVFPMRKGEGLVFGGLISLQDLPRPAVPDCQIADIKVIMVTVDHPDTDEVIAKHVNIAKALKMLAKGRGGPPEQVQRFDEAIDAVVSTDHDLKTLSPKENEDYGGRDPGLHDGGEVVVEQTHVGGVLGDIGADNTHGDTDVGRLERGGVVDTITCHSDDVFHALGLADGVSTGLVLEALHDLELVVGGSTGDHEHHLLEVHVVVEVVLTPLILIPLLLPVVLILGTDLGTDMIPAISLAYETPLMMRVARLAPVKLLNVSYLQIGMVQAAAGFYIHLTVLMNFGPPPAFMPGTSQWFTKNAQAIVHNLPYGAALNGTMIDTAGKLIECPESVIGALYPVMEFCGTGFIDEPCECAELPACAFTEESLCWDTSFRVCFICPYFFLLF